MPAPRSFHRFRTPDASPLRRGGTWSMIKALAGPCPAFPNICIAIYIRKRETKVVANPRSTVDMANPIPPNNRYGKRFPGLLLWSLIDPDINWIIAPIGKPINDITPRAPFLSKICPKTLIVPISNTSRILKGSMTEPTAVQSPESPKLYKLKLVKLRVPKRKSLMARLNGDRCDQIWKGFLIFLNSWLPKVPHSC